MRCPKGMLILFSVVFICLWLTPVLRADLYVYRDKNGVCRFSNKKLPGYEPYIIKEKQVAFSPSNKPANKNKSKKVLVPVNNKNDALSNIKFKDEAFFKGGFDSILLLNCTLENNCDKDVKDIEITCVIVANSGTTIGINKEVVYEIIPAGKAISLYKFNMGFIHPQAAKIRITVTDLSLLQ